MPEAKFRRGYSHWNPDNPEAPIVCFLGVPRLSISREQAKRRINSWFLYPNGRNAYYQNHEGEYDEDFRLKPDNRKKEDLEVVKIEMRIKK